MTVRPFLAVSNCGTSVAQLCPGSASVQDTARTQSPGTVHLHDSKAQSQKWCCAVRMFSYIQRKDVLINSLT
jgi:hypothetical protein